MVGSDSYLKLKPGPVFGRKGRALPQRRSFSALLVVAALLTLLGTGGCGSDSGTALCSAAAKRCNSNIVEVCTADGAAWVVYQQCQASEQCQNGACASALASCGNTLCEANLGESSANCPTDCPAPQSCGNGQCEPSLGESSASCPADCSEPGCTNPSWKQLALTTHDQLTFGASEAWSSAANDIYLAGSANVGASKPRGAVFHFDGSSWSELGNSSSLPFQQLHIGGSGLNDLLIAPQDYIFTLEEMAILAFDGSGWTATERPAELAQVFRILGFGPGQAVVLGTVRGAMNATTSVLFQRAGQSWQTSNNIDPQGVSIFIRDIWGASPSQLFGIGFPLGSTDLGLYQLTGTSWSRLATVPATDYSEISGSGPTDLYIATDSGLYHYDGSRLLNAGLPLSQYHEVFAVSVCGPSDVYAATAEWVVGGELALSHFDGTSWTAMDISQFGLERIDDLRCVAANQLIAIGKRGEILHYACH